MGKFDQAAKAFFKKYSDNSPLLVGGMNRFFVLHE